MLLFGAAAGSLLDSFHTHSGTTKYTHEIAFKMAWWTPLLFALAYTVLGVSYRVLDEHCSMRLQIKHARVEEMLGFCVLYYVSGFLPASNLVKLLVMMVGGGLLWCARDRAFSTLLLGTSAAVVGPLCEIILVQQGAFSHLQPDFLGIPMWLPGLYFASAPAACFVAWLGTQQERQLVANRSSVD
jgi:hypothetical protein